MYFVPSIVLVVYLRENMVSTHMKLIVMKFLLNTLFIFLTVDNT